MPSLHPFQGVIQHYAWGGTSFLPELLRRENPEREPWAELWMGAHAKGPGRLTDREGTLLDLIAASPAATLGDRVAERFDGRLPFLFKVLDVRDMLSIQVHPTKKAAEKGYAREEENGPPRDAPDRNYRDDNHKPELGVALTDFYLLHGFRPETEISATLREIPGWDKFIPTLEKKGVKALYRRIMEAEQSKVNRWLQPLVDSLSSTDQYTRDQPEFWASRAVDQYSRDGHHDRGLFSVLWFNLVHLKPGEGIFQDAGIPHAYLEGVCIELMANSDNVLRGGLTQKHIDVPELLEHTNFSAVAPRILTPREAGDGWKIYPTPAPDFSLYRATPGDGESLRIPVSDRPGILLLLSGEVTLNGIALDADHRTVFISAGSDVVIQAGADSELLLATTGEV